MASVVAAGVWFRPGVGWGSSSFTVSKLECFKQLLGALYTISMG